MRQSEFEISITVHGPQEFTEQSFREYFFDFHFISFAPSHANPRIVIIGLTCPQGDLLSLIFFLQNFYIIVVLLYSLEILSSSFFIAVTVASLVSGNFLGYGFIPSISINYSAREIVSLFAEN